MHPSGLSIFWRAFAATAAALVLATVLLIVTPVKVSPRIALIEVQVLTGVLLELDALAPSLPTERQNDLVATKGAVRQALEEVRRISRELRPEMLEHLGLVSALTELTSVLSRQTGIQIERDFQHAL